MKDLTKGNEVSLIISFSIPVLFGNILQLLYSIADIRIVGDVLGEESLAAVGAVSPVNVMIIGFLLGMTNGFSILCARSFGAKKEEEFKKNVGATIVLALITCILLSIISILCLKPLLRILNTPQNIFKEAYDYILILCLGMTITVLYNICSAILRAIGDTFTPLCFLAIAVGINIILDYTLMKYTTLSVKGAAIATLIAQFISAVLCIQYMRRKYEILRLKKEHFKVTLPLARQMYQSGLSMGLMNSIVSIGTVSLQSAINDLGDVIIIAHTGARKLTEVFMMMFTTLGTTMATYCGQNVGAGKIKRVRDGIKKAVMIGFLWSGIVIAVTWTLAPILIQLVTASDDSEVIRNAVRYLRFDTAFYFVAAMIIIIRNAMQGFGEIVTPIISSIIEMTGKVLVVLLLTPHLKYEGIIIAEPIVWILMVIPLLIRIKTTPILKG